MNLAYSKDHMKTLEGLLGLRKHFSMYLGGNDHRTQSQSNKEILDNNLDEHDLLGISTPVEIYFCFKEGKYQVIFRDYGRGIPPESLDRASGTPHTSGKFEVSTAYKGDSTGTHGLGLKLAVAISKNAMILCCNSNQMGFIRYRDIEEKTFMVENIADPHQSGTIVILEYDPTIINGVENYEKEGLPDFLDYVLFLCMFSEKLNIHVGITNTWINPENFDRIIKRDGIKEGFRVISNLKFNKMLFTNDNPISFDEYLRRKFETNSPKIWELGDFKDDGSDDRISYDTKLFLTKNLKVNKGGIMATVNMLQINDSQSHHILGIQEVLKERLAVMIEDEDMMSWFMSSYRLPIYYIIKLRYVSAQFTDQTKKGFRDANFSKRYKMMLEHHFDRLDPNILADLYELLKEDIERRFLEAFSKVYTGTKGLKNVSLFLKNPQGWQPCVSNDKDVTELYIVEGRSAFSNATSACDTNRQAVLAQQGKPINGFKTATDKFLNYGFIKDLMLILGVSPKDKDLSNMNFSKIYILADADEHGYHICSLILGNLYKINPLIVESGRVVLSNPPLYAISLKDTVMFLKDYDALMESRIETMYRPAFIFHTAFTGTDTLLEIDGDAFVNICYIITHIGTILNKAATSIGIDEHTLEVLLKCLSHDYGNYTLDKERARQMLGADAIITQKDHLIISIAASDKVIPWGRFIDECRKYLYYEYARLRCHEYDLYVSTRKSDELVKVPMMFTGILKLMHKLADRFGSFERFKGLGSMNTEQLRETCFDNRTRSYVPMKGVGEMNKIYGMLGVDTAKRKLLSKS